MRAKFLVVGTGRSGTTWCAETLRAGGLDVGHQTYRHEHVLGDPAEPWDGADRDGEVSFEAVPHAARFRADGYRVVLVVRDWVAVTASWLARGAFALTMAADYTAWYESIRRHTPDVLSWPTDEARAAAYWGCWNLLASRRAHVILPLASLTPDLLAAAVGHPAAVGPLLPPINTGPPTAAAKIREAVPSPLVRELDRLSTAWGTS